MYTEELNKSDSYDDEEVFDEKFFEMFRIAMEDVINKEVEEFMNIDTSDVVFSKRFKKRMNRFFREYVGGKIPYPEVDNFFERLRSKLDKRLKIK